MQTALDGYRYGRIAVRGFNVQVQAVALGRAVYFPLRPLVAALGMARQMQIKKLRTDSRFRDAFRPLPVPTRGGLQETWCINKKAVTTWLITVDPARCPMKAKGVLGKFQAELFAAADRFLFGETGATVYDPVTKTDAPLTGTIQSYADCPYCGGHLCVTVDVGAGKTHLTPADGEGESEDEDEE